MLQAPAARARVVRVFRVLGFMVSGHRRQRRRRVLQLLRRALGWSGFMVSGLSACASACTRALVHWQALRATLRGCLDWRGMARTHRCQRDLQMMYLRVAPGGAYFMLAEYGQAVQAGGRRCGRGAAKLIKCNSRALLPHPVHQ